MADRIEAEASINLDEFIAGLRGAEVRADVADRKMTSLSSKLAQAESRLERFESEFKRKGRQLGKKIAFEAGTELVESLVSDVLPEGADPFVRFGQSIARGGIAGGVPGAIIAGLVSFVKESVGAIKKRMDDFAKTVAELRRKDENLARDLELIARKRRDEELRIEREIDEGRTSFRRLEQRDEFLKDALYQAAIIGGRR